MVRMTRGLAVPFIPESTLALTLELLEPYLLSASPFLFSGLNFTREYLECYVAQNKIKL